MNWAGYLLCAASAVLIAVTVALFLSPSSAMAAETMDGRIFDAWRTSCRIDAMTDRKTCIVLQPPLVVGTQGIAQSRVLIGMHHYPGSYVYLRLGEDEPVSIEAPGWSGNAAADLIARMREASRIRVRYTAFAGRRVMDAEIDPTGFAQAIDWAIDEATAANAKNSR